MERWFGARPEDDRFIRRHFEPDVDAAVQGRLGNWRRTPRGCVALIILLDQFPRAMYRGSPRAYAQDPKAVGLCLWGLARRMDARLAPLQRAFFYLPLEHAEDLELQRESVRRYARLAEEAPPGLRTALASFDLYARRHYRVIEKFGRFPQRNEILGRTSTAEERDYLRRATAAT